MSGLENSENSNSVHSQTTGSPFSSPAQLVPGIESTRNRYFDDVSMHSARKSRESKEPYLDIIIQPQEQFRFRYYSEMGTHGCLQGKQKSKDLKKKGRNSNKTYPTVELKNYTGKAVIKCQLYQADKDVEHPHKLLEDENKVPNVVVPDGKSYTVCFEGLGVMFKSKKSIPDLIYAKKEKDLNKKYKKKSLQEECNEIAKNINLNIVRLRFSAHDVKTGEEICKPVYSDPVYNNKNANTNELKIVLSSQYCGSVMGGYNIILLVEKVSKKNVRVNVFDKDREWTWSIPLVDSNIHHQYAIVFPMPRYKNVQITKSVDVYIELHREIDGHSSTSNTIEFKYTPEPFYKMSKKRKLDSLRSNVPKDRIKSPQSSITISEGPPIENLRQSDVSMSSLFDTQTVLTDHPAGAVVCDYYVQPTMCTGYDSNCDAIDNKIHLLDGDPMLSQVNGVKLPAPVQQPYNVINNMSLKDDLEQFEDNFDIEEYLGEVAKSFKVDSGRPCSRKNTNIKKEIPVYYRFTSEECVEIKELIREICEMKKCKSDFRGIIKDKMDRLFEIRLSNGDTFLAMTLTSNAATFKFIVNTAAYVGADYLLNSSNNLQQTVLHLAIVHDMPDVVTFLIDKGCEPMCADIDGNTALHYAVMYKACLSNLLEAMHRKLVKYNLNSFNREFQTPLLLAIASDYEDGALVLLQHGAEPCEGTESTAHELTDSQDSQTGLRTTTAINYFTVKPFESYLDVGVRTTQTNQPQDVCKKTPLYEVLDNTKLIDTSGGRSDFSASVKNLLTREISQPQVDCKERHQSLYVATANETKRLNESEKRSSIPARPALHAAIHSASLSMIKLLLDFIPKDNIDLTDWKGMTALQTACDGPLREHTLDVIKILLEKGANPMYYTRDTKPAWRLARRHHSMWDVVRPYVRAGIDDDYSDGSSDSDDDFHSADEGESSSTDYDISANMECLKIGEPVAVSAV